jgi:hypothetical protein
MPRGRRAALLGALALGACLDPIPQGTLTPVSASVAGVVRRRCGDQPPVPGARILLDGVVRVETDEDGIYRIDGVRAGTAHTMAADYPGYIHAETIVRVTPGATTAQNFALEQPGDAREDVLLDVLFVIDNGADMGPAQETLVAAFPALAAVLEQGSINLHLGIVTTDRGAGPTLTPSCRPRGDDGVLQVQPRGGTCDVASLRPYEGAPYLSLVRDASEVVGANFDGSLADVFACYAPLGTSGCRFAMPLAAVARALDPRRTENGDFVRDGAALLVVIVTNRDDCSAPDETELFDPFQTAPDSPLGPLSRYRCFEFGALCGGQPPGRAPGVRPDCEPGAPDADPAHQLDAIDAYTTLLGATHGGRVVVGVVAGPPSPVEVAQDTDGHPYLVATCSGPTGLGEPALRLATLAAAMPQTNRASICRDYRADFALWAQQAVDMAVGQRACE